MSSHARTTIQSEINKINKLNTTCKSSAKIMCHHQVHTPTPTPIPTATCFTSPWPSIPRCLSLQFHSQLRVQLHALSVVPLFRSPFPRVHARHNNMTRQQQPPPHHNTTDCFLSHLDRCGSNMGPRMLCLLVQLGGNPLCFSGSP